MDKEKEDKKLKVITFTGKSYEFDYIPIMTIAELKLAILGVDSTVPDFDFLYAGRMIRSNDKILEEFINADNLTIYTNSKGVHGGCYKIGGGGCG